MKGWMLAISLFLALTATLFMSLTDFVYGQSQAPTIRIRTLLAAMEMAAPPSRLGDKLLGLPVNSERIRKHEKTTTCEFTGGACGESYRSRPLARGS